MGRVVHDQLPPLHQIMIGEATRQKNAPHASCAKQMKALSIRQPWAWLIAHGHKDIENRVWQTGHRGPLLIHASKGMTQQEYEDVCRFLYSKERLRYINALLPMPNELERGGIVGRAEVTGCYSDHASPRFIGS